MKIIDMWLSYTAKYTNIYGKLVELPEVVTEGRTIEECREMLKDAVHQMVLAYHQQGKEIPRQGGRYLFRYRMSVKRRDLIRYFESNGFYFLQEGGNHTIYTNGGKLFRLKRYRRLERITANELCKQCGLKPIF